MHKVSQPEPGDTYQAARVIVGHCPECMRVVVVFNNFESWPLVTCTCGWQGQTTDVRNRVRAERDNVLIVPDAQLRRVEIERALDARRDVRWWDTGVRLIDGRPELRYTVSLNNENELKSWTLDEVIAWLAGER